MSAIQNRYDFVYLFDCLDGNPNGDPDAANAPRLDPQTLQGIVSDVCLKRKVRNYAQMRGQPIFIQHHGILNTEIDKAEPQVEKRNREERNQAAKWMCKNFYDVRAFGAVMSTGSNAGQVRGPLQITFSRSIDPIVSQDLCITRVAITKVEDKDKKETEMGRKNLIPYGLYRCHGFVNANLAQEPNGTGFSEEDLSLFWESLKMMFDHDRSASRGTMSPQMLTVFKHVGTDADQKQRSTQAKLGCAPAHKLFELVKVEKKVENPRKYGDYTVDAPPAGALNGFPGVEVLILL